MLLGGTLPLLPLLGGSLLGPLPLLGLVAARGLVTVEATVTTPDARARVYCSGGRVTVLLRLCRRRTLPFCCLSGNGIGTIRRCRSGIGFHGRRLGPLDRCGRLFRRLDGLLSRGLRSGLWLAATAFRCGFRRRIRIGGRATGIGRCVGILGCLGGRLCGSRSRPHRTPSCLDLCFLLGISARLGSRVGRLRSSRLCVSRLRVNRRDVGRCGDGFGSVRLFTTPTLGLGSLLRRLVEVQRELLGSIILIHPEYLSSCRHYARIATHNSTHELKMGIKTAPYPRVGAIVALMATRVFSKIHLCAGAPTNQPKPCGPCAPPSCRQSARRDAWLPRDLCR